VSLLTGSHSRCWPAQDRTFGCHEHQVGDEYEVGWRYPLGFDMMNYNPEVPIGF
jgi:hypothetical protein